MQLNNEYWILNMSEIEIERANEWKKNWYCREKKLFEIFQKFFWRAYAYARSACANAHALVYLRTNKQTKCARTRACEWINVSIDKKKTGVNMVFDTNVSYRCINCKLFRNFDEIKNGYNVKFLIYTNHAW